MKSQNDAPAGQKQVASEIGDAINDIKKAISSANEVNSDTLELTEVVEKAATSAQQAKSVEKGRSPQPQESAGKEKSEDIFKRIDENVAEKRGRATPSSVSKNTDVGMESERVASSENGSTSNSYIAEEVARQSQDLLRSFIKATSKNHHDDTQFRSGRTLEDLVIELLKPELTNWLNKNLHHIVRDVVEREVRKLIPQDE